MGARNPLKGPRGKVPRDTGSEADGMEGKNQRASSIYVGRGLYTRRSQEERVQSREASKAWGSCLWDDKLVSDWFERHRLRTLSDHSQPRAARRTICREHE